MASYPLARAFGSPAEAELRRCRAAFLSLRRVYPGGRVVIFDARDPLASSASRFPESRTLVARRLRELGAAGAEANPVLPPIPPAPYRGNQLRYAWDRAHAYGAWIREFRPCGDAFVFLEIIAAPGGRALGIQLYVLDPAGRVAYLRLWNSHHFGARPPEGVQAIVELALLAFRRDLDQKPEEIFPPWGVG